jgi:phosphatidylinositol 4-kinase
VAQLSLLEKSVLKYLDGLAGETFSSQTASKYPYKSFSETLNLVLVTVLKQILSGHGQLPLSFMTDIQELVRSLFTSGQTELQSRHFDQHKHLLMESKTTSSSLTSATR